MAAKPDPSSKRGRSDSQTADRQPAVQPADSTGKIQVDKYVSGREKITTIFILKENI